MVRGVRSAPFPFLLFFCGVPFFFCFLSSFGSFVSVASDRRSRLGFRSLFFWTPRSSFFIEIKSSNDFELAFRFLDTIGRLFSLFFSILRLHFNPGRALLSNGVLVFRSISCWNSVSSCFFRWFFECREILPGFYRVFFSETILVAVG